MFVCPPTFNELREREREREREMRERERERESIICRISNEFRDRELFLCPHLMN